MSNQPLIIERILDAPLEKVWKALTDKTQMKEWYFQLDEFKAEPGFEFKFDVEHEGNHWIHHCKVQEVLPYEKLSYTWKYEGYPGESLVSWELMPEGDQTRVKIVHTGLETFPQNIPSLAKTSFEAGWTSILGTSLREYVETAHIINVFEIKAPASQVWKLFTNDDEIKKWAGAFGEGTYSESNWSLGSDVAWKTAAGETGARGKVVELEENSKLKISFFDDTEPKPGEELGTYFESYLLTEKNGITTVTADSGPLQLTYVNKHKPLWEKAIKKIKELLEK